MEPVTIVVSGLIGLLANYLFDAIKQWVKRSKTRDILIRTKEGETITIAVDKNMSVDEIDSKVVAAIGKQESPKLEE